MHKSRLRRLEWLFTDHPVYFLTACVQDRRRLLANDEIYDSFKTFGDVATRFEVLVGRYMIMPDHVHFFAAFNPKSPSLSKWMKSWKNALSKTLRGMGIPPKHWEKDFFDHVLRSGESYGEKWRYVRENPVRAGLVRRSEDWPYQGEIHRFTANDLPNRRRQPL
jgi:REP element-mobilizing transposase RayT